MMKRLLAATMTLILVFPCTSTLAGDSVRTVEVTSIPLTDGSIDGRDATSSTGPAKPESLVSPPPFLSRQTALLNPDGTIQTRCDGGSRHNFATVQRGAEAADVLLKGGRR